jgi:hypothetical protein
MAFVGVAHFYDEDWANYAIRGPAPVPPGVLGTLGLQLRLELVHPLLDARLDHQREHDRKDDLHEPLRRRHVANSMRLTGRSIVTRNKSQQVIESIYGKLGQPAASSPLPTSSTKWPLGPA